MFLVRKVYYHARALIPQDVCRWIFDQVAWSSPVRKATHLQKGWQQLWYWTIQQDILNQLRIFASVGMAVRPDNSCTLLCAVTGGLICPGGDDYLKYEREY